MSWQFLAVTSPTAACGKTVTACNLADEHCAVAGEIGDAGGSRSAQTMVADYLGVAQ